MIKEIIFCLCDEFAKVMCIQDDPKVGMSTAEVMTTTLVAARFFGGNIEASRYFLQATLLLRLASSSFG